MYGDPIGLALDAAHLNHAADAKRTPLRRFIGRDLRGVKKNTRFCWNADSTSVAASAKPATPATIKAIRR